MTFAVALGATPLQTPADFGRGYSAVGITDEPPVVNPEAISLLGALKERGIPVIAITHTARRESTWQEFLHSRTRLNFQDVITSGEVAHAKPHRAMFEEAARRLSVPTRGILHVGDRWELDVVGALDAGCGAVLYSGLWPLYPDGMYPKTEFLEARRAGTPRINRLDNLLSSRMLLTVR